jgi:hypothetical protein
LEKRVFDVACCRQWWNTGFPAFGVAGKTLIVLRNPFRVAHASPVGIDAFANRDSHYPVARGYKDMNHQEILLAPI